MLLAVSDLVIGYRRGIDVVRGMSLTVDAGEIVSIIGPNGAGKSTFLKSVAGVIPTWSGEVTISGTAITHAKPEARLAEGLAFVPQLRSVFPQMSVYENLLMGGYTHRANRNLVRQRIEDTFRIFPELRERLEQPAGLLSGGQQRMVEIARSLVSGPRCLLMDEPTAGLAPLVAERVYETIAHLRESGLTIVLVDQVIDAAVSISDRVYTMVLGRNEYALTRAEIQPRIVEIISGWLSPEAVDV